MGKMIVPRVLLLLLLIALISFESVVVAVDSSTDTELIKNEKLEPANDDNRKQPSNSNPVTLSSNPFTTEGSSSDGGEDGGLGLPFHNEPPTPEECTLYCHKDCERYTRVFSRDFSLTWKQGQRCYQSNRECDCGPAPDDFTTADCDRFCWKNCDELRGIFSISKDLETMSEAIYEGEQVKRRCEQARRRCTCGPNPNEVNRQTYNGGTSYSGSSYGSGSTYGSGGSSSYDSSSSNDRSSNQTGRNRSGGVKVAAIVGGMIMTVLGIICVGYLCRRNQGQGQVYGPGNTYLGDGGVVVAASNTCGAERSIAGGFLPVQQPPQVYPVNAGAAVPLMNGAQYPYPQQPRSVTSPFPAYPVQPVHPTAPMLRGDSEDLPPPYPGGP